MVKDPNRFFLGFSMCGGYIFAYVALRKKQFLSHVGNGLSYCGH